MKKHFMKRFYYNVGEFTPENESELGFSQEQNDYAFIGELFHKLKLDPAYPQEQRDEVGIDYVGQLEYHFFHWEGDQLKWILHTLKLISQEFNKIEKRKSHIGRDWNKEKERIMNWFNVKKTEFSDKEGMNFTNTGYIDDDKIKWLGKPAEFGFLFSELLAKGWIKGPGSEQKVNRKKYARLLFKHFDANTNSFDSLYHEFTSTASLSDAAKFQFRIKENQGK